MSSPRTLRLLLIGLSLCGAGAGAALLAALSTEAPGDALIAGFKSTSPASVSAAVEFAPGKTGRRGYDMKLMPGAKVGGRAVTALAGPAPADQATASLAVKHSV